jgi:hypothetical protein
MDQSRQRLPSWVGGLPYLSGRVILPRAEVVDPVRGQTARGRVSRKTFVGVNAADVPLATKKAAGILFPTRTGAVRGSRGRVRAWNDLFAG